MSRQLFQFWKHKRTILKIDVNMKVVQNHKKAELCPMLKSSLECVFHSLMATSTVHDQLTPAAGMEEI